jgi:hypothetical protein
MVPRDADGYVRIVVIPFGVTTMEPWMRQQVKRFILPGQEVFGSTHERRSPDSVP